MPAVHYRFDLGRPHTHRIGVTITLPAHGELHLDLTLPAWLPGAYKLIDNARNLHQFAARSSAGEPLRFERLNWQTWRVFDGGAGAVVAYEMFWNKPEIHQGQLDAHHAFINPGTTALYAQGHQEDWGVTLEVEAPADWHVATGLEATGERSFVARHYDDFVEAPLMVGEHAIASFEQDGVTYEVVYEGAQGFQPTAIVGALKRVIAAATDFWGVPPIDRYVFMYLETDAGYLNGLEHRNSTIITGPIADPAQRDGLLAITTHELFHLWNVKRLRPVGFGPYDYTKEAHTTGLWVVEGFTEYYTDLLVLRAGLNRPETFLSHVASNIEQLEAMPGRHHMSLEEASWTTWHFGDDRWSGALNYYVKGYLLGAALDLELRGRSDNQVSLDDVMRAMWDAYGAAETPYEPAAFCAMAESLLGESLEAFWAHHLRGREDYDWARMLNHAGLQLVTTEVVPTLGVSVKAAEGGLLLENVLADSAAQRAGLMKGDLLVAIAGRRATPQGLATLGNRHEPGDGVELAYFRRERLQVARATLAGRSHYAIAPQADATAAQQALLASWLSPVQRQERGSSATSRTAAVRRA